MTQTEWQVFLYVPSTNMTNFSVKIIFNPCVSRKKKKKQTNKNPKQTKEKKITRYILLISSNLREKSYLTDALPLFGWSSFTSLLLLNSSSRLNALCYLTWFLETSMWQSLYQNKICLLKTIILRRVKLIKILDAHFSML